ncbi:unnamed protein product, partial [Amoebophrya sp. A120]
RETVLSNNKKKLNQDGQDDEDDDYRPGPGHEEDGHEEDVHEEDVHEEEVNCFKHHDDNLRLRTFWRSCRW